MDPRAGKRSPMSGRLRSIGEAHKPQVQAILSATYKKRIEFIYPRQIDASRLHGEGYRKLWARLRFAGIRASLRRVRRVMRENGLLAPHRVLHTEAKLHDGTIITDKVNEMWGTDMTQTITIREGRANVFVAVEHANSEVIDIHASRSANRFEALEPPGGASVLRSHRSRCGAWIEAASRSWLQLHVRRFPGRNRMPSH